MTKSRPSVPGVSAQGTGMLQWVAGSSSWTGLRTDFKICARKYKLCKFICCFSCTFCNRAAAKERHKSSTCKLKVQSLKYVNNALCVDHLCSVTPVANVPNVAPNLPVGARLQNYWTKWLDLGANPIVVQILKRGLPPPLSDPTQTDKKSHGHKLLCKSPQEQLPSGGIASAYSQKCNRNRTKPKISRLLQPAISKQKVETYTGSQQTQSFPQGGEIQNGNPRNHPDFPPTRGVGYLNRLQGRLLPHTHTPEVPKISPVSCPGSDLPVQSTSLWPLNSSYGVHCNSQGSETDGYKQGY